MDKQKKAHLLSQSHALNPAVTVAEKGLSETVQLEIEAALKAHGLIKIKFAGYSKADKQTLLSQICPEFEAELVQLIGHIGIIYRPKPPKTRPAPTARTQLKRAGPKKARERSRGTGANKGKPEQKRQGVHRRKTTSSNKSAPRKKTQSSTTKRQTVWS
jgi:putative YhbY family RNA-binding protein